MSWLALLLAVVFSVGFASCDKDDDDDKDNGGPGTEAGVNLSIVGIWKYTFSSGYITYTFNANGSKHSIFRLDTHRDLTYLCAVTFKNNDYGKRKSKLPGGI